MRAKDILLSTALIGALAGAPAFAQSQSQPQSGAQPPPPQQQQTQGQQQGGQQQQQTAQGGGAQIYIAPTDVRRIQQKLNEEGFDVGSVDGTWNDGTRQAAQNYQEEKGLATTGTLTVELVTALGMQDILQGGQQGGQQQAQSGQETGEGTPLEIGPSGIRQIQQALNEAGYSVDQVNGQFDSSTKEAARNFLQAQGRSPSDNLTVELISALDLSQQVFQGGGGQQQAQGGQQTQGQQQAQSEPLYVGPETVQQLTQKLNTEGFSAGEINGDWQDDTSEAARNYQQQQGLPPTGTLTTVTLSALGMSNWMQGGASATGAIGGQGGGQSGGSMQGGASGSMGQSGGSTGGNVEIETVPIQPQ